MSTRKTTRPMFIPRVENGYLICRFHDGLTGYFSVPHDPNDKDGVRVTRDAACAWAREAGATDGQCDMIGKALRTAGYYVVGPHYRSPVTRVPRPSCGPMESDYSGAYLM